MILEDEKTQETIERNSISLFSNRFRTIVRIGLTLSAVVGFYVFKTSESFSSVNTFGLLAISTLDLVFVLLLTFVKRLNLPSIALSIVTSTLLVELFFATSPILVLFSFGLLVFDALLITQFAIGVASFLATSRSQALIPRESQEDVAGSGNSVV